MCQLRRPYNSVSLACQKEFTGPLITTYREYNSGKRYKYAISFNDLKKPNLEDRNLIGNWNNQGDKGFLPGNFNWRLGIYIEHLWFNASFWLASKNSVRKVLYYWGPQEKCVPFIGKGRPPKVNPTCDWGLAASLAESAITWAFCRGITLSTCSGVSGCVNSHLKSTLSKALGGSLSNLIANKEFQVGGNSFPFWRTAHPDSPWYLARTP